MGVARHDHPHTGRGRLDVEHRKIMDDVQPDPAELEQRSCWKRARPGRYVIVAAHRRDRRQGGQRLENRLISDVAAVHDVIAALQEFFSLRSQQTMGIGD
jgi:hypothetical protein